MSTSDAIDKQVHLAKNIHKQLVLDRSKYYCIIGITVVKRYCKFA